MTDALESVVKYLESWIGCHTSIREVGDSEEATVFREAIDKRSLKA